MRVITKIIVHHSASPLTTKAEDIERWHVERGFSEIGYHYVIEQTGGIVIGRPLEKIGAHCKGHNRDSIGICLVGDNTKADQRWTLRQWETLAQLVLDLQARGYPPVFGHRDLAPTECPGIEDVGLRLIDFIRWDRARKNVA